MKKQTCIHISCDLQQKMLGCKILCTCLNVKSFLYCIFGKKGCEEIKITVYNYASHKRVYNKRLMSCGRWRGLSVRAGQAMKVCVCVFCKVWPYYMNLFRSYVSFCYRPFPLPRPLFASWSEQVISDPLVHD